jgi:colanic acid biosynthesis protein WcaH
VVDRNWIKPEEYQEIMARCPVCTVDVIFFNPEKTQVLIGKRNNEPLRGEYFSIGGRLQKNEELLTAACRQAKRELGLEINPAGLVFGGVINEIFDNSPFPGINYHTVNLYYGYILPSGQEIKLDSQHSEVVWFHLTKQDELHPFLQERINQLKFKI